MDNIYIKDVNGELVLAKEYDKIICCGLYAGVGYGVDTKAGDLFVVVCGPALWPAYNKQGKRINVGDDKAGLSYSLLRKEWYKE